MNLLLPVDQDNIHMIDSEEFRGFNTLNYKYSYAAYRGMTHNFKSLNTVSKKAGQSSVNMEMPCCLSGDHEHQS